MRRIAVTLKGRAYVLIPVGTGSIARIFHGTPAAGGVDPKLTVKILRDRWRGSPEMRGRFREEGRLLKTLKHEGLPRWVAAGRLGDRDYMAYRYIDGSPLLRTLSIVSPKGGGSYTATCALIGQLLDILAYLHKGRHAIVHSDVSPENLLIDGKRLHLIDFGCAQRLKPGGRTHADRWIGKPTYLSPEQAQGLPWDQRSDLYQAGIVFYELLTGRKFNQGRDAREARMLAADPPLPDWRRIPVVFKVVLEGMLDADPEKRWKSCAHCRDALARGLGLRGQM